MTALNILVAFIAGVLSFLSPCVLPLVPAFVAYISGVSLDKIKSNSHQRSEIFLNSIFYVMGFAFVFSIFGILLNTIFSGIAYSLRVWFSRIGGAIIILFGLYIMGILKISFLDARHGPKIKTKKYGYATSFIFGAAFAVGWTPCVGAILGAVLTLAALEPVNAFYLLFAYSLGLGTPFLLVGLFTSQASNLIKKSGKFMKYFNVIVGLFLIIIGILVFTNSLSSLANLTLPAQILSGGV